MNFPNDVDGDVFRRLDTDNFDFTADHEIDFNVDFKSWPPSDRAVEILKNQYSKVIVIQPDEKYEGYVPFSLVDKLQYPLVMEVQALASKLMEPFGGVCESWGVLQE